MAKSNSTPEGIANQDTGQEPVRTILVRDLEEISKLLAQAQAIIRLIGAGHNQEVPDSCVQDSAWACCDLIEEARETLIIRSDRLEGKA